MLASRPVGLLHGGKLSTIIFNAVVVDVRISIETLEKSIPDGVHFVDEINIISFGNNRQDTIKQQHCQADQLDQWGSDTDI